MFGAAIDWQPAGFAKVGAIICCGRVNAWLRIRIGGCVE